ncbi:FecCD family ABC transporter permease [Cohnella thailandensis]|uniref:Iron ABC transporter permease n=1 Tax=Cohnella thailandensis TaxID=557557 RepID=A0A841SVC5_9BACL|nr:iron ABC transporter permease [Cohnella thailandensis]MBB6634939.1 iron ABC transporter permease [Cohnella thailandensis]MBP1975839.1 iron complex transport system permease protein [Cohnella thailandensis]
MNVQARNDRRRWIGIALAPILIASVLYGIGSGSVSISVPEIWRIVFNEGDPAHEAILWNLRLPRVLVGLLVGACLAASGALLQGVMRNPLADPGIIGVSAGGGLAAVVALVLFPQFGYLLPGFAFGGALLSAMMIYLLAWDGGSSPTKIVLAGIAVNALLGGVMNGIMVLNSDRIQSVIPWLAGGLAGRSWPHLQFLLPYAVIGLSLVPFAAKASNLLTLGDQSAQSLGQHVERQRFLIVALASLLAGAAVSVAGLVGFVGLIVPHAIRLLIGDDYRYLLPYSIAGGAALMVAADTAARSWFDPIELPAGVLLACIGAPFFLVLLKRRRLVR